MTLHPSEFVLKQRAIEAEITKLYTEIAALYAEAQAYEPSALRPATYRDLFVGAVLWTPRHPCPSERVEYRWLIVEGAFSGGVFWSNGSPHHLENGLYLVEQEDINALQPIS